MKVFKKMVYLSQVYKRVYYKQIKMNFLGRYRMVLGLFGWLIPTVMAAQEWDDKIIITQNNDDYTFAIDDGKPVVKNEKRVVFQSNSASTVYPEMVALYGEFIKLEDVSGSGEKIYKNITPENVFYDDTKGCILRSEIRKKGKTSKGSYERIFKDTKYFTRVYLLENYFVRSKTVTITIPKTLSGYHIQEMNFKGFPIESTHETTKDGEVYRYTVTDAKRMKEDDRMPPFANVYPYLLIKGSFADVNALYAWSKAMADVDVNVPNMKDVLAEINVQSKTDVDRISNTFHWVQDHVRYVAFEAGLSGHRPDTPKEVLRKRYGDCKGMALLLKTLLKAQGFDARLTDIGTTEIPYRMSDVPTLAAANHAICTLFFKGKTYYLDATCNYIPYDYVPQHIQGSQAMIENGVKPLLQIVPRSKPDTSIDSLNYVFEIKGNALTGKAQYHLRGDMKEWFMTSLASASQKDHGDYLGNNLNADNHRLKIFNVKWQDNNAQHTWACFVGDVVNEAALQRDGNDLYVDLNPHNYLFAGRIDTAQRVHDYYFPVRCNVVRQASLVIPAGYVVDYLPPSATFTTPEGTLTCQFTKKGNTIVYHQKLQISKRRMALANIVKWNEAMRKWKDACNEQIVLKRRG